jgi:hypothetical protein
VGAYVSAQTGFNSQTKLEFSFTHYGYKDRLDQRLALSIDQGAHFRARGFSEPIAKSANQSP